MSKKTSTHGGARAGAGAPAKSDDIVKSGQVNLKVGKEDRRKIDEACDLYGVTLTSVVRAIPQLLDLADKKFMATLRKVGKPDGRTRRL